MHNVPLTGPMLRAFASAAAVDPEIAAAWRSTAAAGIRTTGSWSSPWTWLREDLDVDCATDIAWTVFDHGASDALMGERGWSLEEFADWLVDSVERLLLR